MDIFKTKWGVILVIGMALHASVVSAATEVALRIRQDLRDLSVPQMQLFVDAVMDMKAAPALGDGQLATNRYDEYAQMHGNFRIHGTSGFLPWHRKLLWQFETDVRQLDPVKYANFTLPYWDFTRQAFPSDLVTRGDGQFLGPDGNLGAMYAVTEGPFRAGQWTTVEHGHHSGTHDLNRMFNPQLFEAITGEFGLFRVSRDLGARGFRGMADAVEVNLHNWVHNAIGGHVGTIHGAIDDPVFWLLHSYVDLLWTRWEAGNGSTTSYEPFFGGPGLGDDLLGFGDAGDAIDIGFDHTLNNTVRDQLDPLNTAALGYTYEFEGTLLLVPVPVPEPASFALAITGAMCIIGFAAAQRRRPRRRLCAVANPRAFTGAGT